MFYVKQRFIIEHFCRQLKESDFRAFQHKKEECPRNNYKLIICCVECVSFESLPFNFPLYPIHNKNKNNLV